MSEIRMRGENTSQLFHGVALNIRPSLPHCAGVAHTGNIISLSSALIWISHCRQKFNIWREKLYSRLVLWNYSLKKIILDTWYWRQVCIFVYAYLDRDIFRPSSILLRPYLPVSILCLVLVKTLCLDKTYFHWDCFDPSVSKVTGCLSLTELRSSLCPGSGTCQDTGPALSLVRSQYTGLSLVTSQS